MSPIIKISLIISSISYEINSSALSGLKAGACSGLILHFDKLSVLSLPKEVPLLTPSLRAELGTIEVSIIVF
jgi:hypothetical protein